jgi:hypothetical protein|nr:MAG TPA_asm: hypothetical protein [Caudoviricetes sp.]
MPFPYFIRKLFQNDGAGEKLNPGVIPTTVNGVAADASGNIAIKDTDIPGGPFLPLSGGSTNGAIRFGDGRSGTCSVGAVADYPRTSARAFGYEFFCNGVKLGEIGVLLGDPGSDYYYQKAQRFYFGPSYNDPMSLQIEPSTGYIIHRDQWLRYVVAAEYNGTQWYRKYNDGWIEQGGTTQYWQNGSAVGYTTISLNTPYSGTNYQIMLTPTIKKGNTGGNGCFYYEEQTKTTTNFHVRKSSIDGLYINWYTCGF